MNEFEGLFKQYYPRLCNYARRFMSDREEAADIVQDCFVRLYEKRATIKDISVASMLFVMVRNSCINRLKRSALLDMKSIDDFSSLEGTEKLYHADFDFSPEGKLLFDELEDQIFKALDTLPEKCRQVFVMSRFEGLKNREIAQKNHTSIQNVEKHIAKAVARLSDYFEKKG